MNKKPLKIAIIFNSTFNIFSVFQNPIGGSESAATYLAIELAKLGHTINLYTLRPNNEQRDCITAFGVDNYFFSVSNNGNINFPANFVENQLDYIIIKNSLPELAAVLPNILQFTPKFIFWTGHAHDQPAIQSLANQEIAKKFTKIVCVSDWHRENMIKHFGLAKSQVIIARNAIAPAFEKLFADFSEFKYTKSTPQAVLTYTSTPFRGLDVLLALYPKLNMINKKLKIFSSMQVYGIKEHDDQFKYLYQQAANLENQGVEYIGSLSQVNLAIQLKSCNILSYPCTFAETSCISVMEAMAAGLHVVTTNLGALQETSLGYASLVDVDMIASVEPEGYLNILVEKCKDLSKLQPEALEQLYYITLQMNKQHTWNNRARDWQQLLSPCN